MNLIEWVVLGVLMLVGMVMSARIMRRGISTLDEKRKECLEQIAAMDRQLLEDRKNMSSGEHVLIMEAAIEDLLRLDNFPEGCSVSRSGKTLELSTPAGLWKVELIMREKDLRLAPRVLHGKGRWRLAGPDLEEFHADPASLMRSLDEHLHSRSQKLEVPPHLARRMRHLPQEPH